MAKQMGLEKDMGNEGCGGRPEKVTGQGREATLAAERRAAAERVDRAVVTVDTGEGESRGNR